ncbi:hypothetical protein ABTD37_20500, partial [Acinetobacter baumannii]
MLAKETAEDAAMGILPDGREHAPLVGSPGLATPSCGGLPQPHARMTCFCAMAKSSMFADMPLDNRTVV